MRLKNFQNLLIESDNEKGICYPCPIRLSRFNTKLKLRLDTRHCKRHGFQSLDTVSGDKNILRFKNFRNLFLQSVKVEVDCHDKLTDVYDSWNFDRVK